MATKKKEAPAIIDSVDALVAKIKAMKEAQPEKSLVMNAVSQYGQKDQIANSPVDLF